MQRVSRMGTIGIVLTCVVLWGVSPGLAATYQMHGRISAVDTAANTVVIEVKQGKELFTVGGPLAPKAMVKKGGKPVQLSAFQVGDWVQVHWERTASGHRITQLEASK